MNTLNQDQTLRASAASAFMAHVYQWMTLGLVATGTVAWFVASSETALQLIFGNSIVRIGLLIGLVAMPFALTSMLPRLSAGAASLWFLLYSALMGVVMSSIFIVYTQSSIVSTFMIAAGTFGGMSIYGTLTKRDLTGMGSFLGMGLWGLILAMVVNWFMKSPALEMGISMIGVLVFTGLTAYDTQRIRQFGENAPLDDATAIRRGAILGALNLYLDFINLFLMLLRLIGDRR